MQDFDIGNDGFLGKREFMRALNLALAFETGDDSDPSPDYTVGGVLSDKEAAEIMSYLDRDRDGRVFWEDFVEYFEGVQRCAGGGGSGDGGGPREAWFQQEGELAAKLLQHMELQGGSTARRSWVSNLRRRFQTADVHETGELDRSVMTMCVGTRRRVSRTLGLIFRYISASTVAGRRPAARLGVSKNGSLCVRPIVDVVECQGLSNSASL